MKFCNDLLVVYFLNRFMTFEHPYPTVALFVPTCQMLDFQVNRFYLHCTVYQFNRFFPNSTCFKISTLVHSFLYCRCPTYQVDTFIFYNNFSIMLVVMFIYISGALGIRLIVFTIPLLFVLYGYGLRWKRQLLHKKVRNSSFVL